MRRGGLPVSEELAKCPECEHTVTTGDMENFKGDLLFFIRCDRCGYKIRSNVGEDRAIANHNRIAGKCRWANAGWGPDYYKCACDGETRTDKENYCPECGKQIEEVEA